MESASDYSFKIPRSTFDKCYDRYVKLVEKRIENGDTSGGLFDLIDIKSGRKPISGKSKKVVVDITKGMKKVRFCFVLTF